MSNILLPVGGLFLCFFPGWFRKWENIKGAITNKGNLNNVTITSAFYIVVKYITPLLVFIILLQGLEII